MARKRKGKRLGAVMGLRAFEEERRLANIERRKAEEKRQRRKFRRMKRHRRIQELKSMPYRDYLKTRHWRRLRVAKIKEAGYACEICCCDSNLNVHHLTYERRGHERMDDLQVLCCGCHQNEHEGEIDGVFDPMTREFLDLVATF